MYQQNIRSLGYEKLSHVPPLVAKRARTNADLVRRTHGYVPDTDQRNALTDQIIQRIIDEPRHEPPDVESSLDVEDENGLDQLDQLEVPEDSISVTDGPIHDNTNTHQNALNIALRRTGSGWEHLSNRMVLGGVVCRPTPLRLVILMDNVGDP